MSTGVDPETQQFAQTLVQGLVTENYINFAVLAVLLYETVAYFEEEVKYFWSKPKSPVSILYFVSRYGAILKTALESLLNFSNANETMCRSMYVQDILNILFLRVRALYSQAFVFEIAGLSMCAFSVPSFAEIVSSWCIPLAYGTLLMILALYKARQFWKESAGFKGFNLVKILIRDQVFYFLAFNVVCIAEILSTTVEANSFWNLVLSAVGDSGLMSIVGGRLLFNMKEAGEKGLNQGISYSLKTVKSNIEFAAPPDGAAGSSLGNPTESVEAEIEEIA